MKKRDKINIGLYIRRHTIEEIAERYLGTGDLEIEKYVAEKVIHSSICRHDVLKVIFGRMSQQAYNEFLRKTPFNSYHFYVILTTSELYEKLQINTFDILATSYFTIDEVADDIFEKILDRYYNKLSESRDAGSLSPDYIFRFLSEHLRGLCKDASNAIEIYKKRESLKKYGIYPGDFLIKDVVYESKNFDYIFAFMYYADDKDKEKLYNGFMNDTNISEDDKLKMQYYYYALADNSKLSEFNSAEDIFLGAALYENYNPINQEFDLVDYLYNKYGSDKVSLYKEKNAELYKKLEEQFYKDKRSSLFKKFNK